MIPLWFSRNFCTRTAAQDMKSQIRSIGWWSIVTKYIFFNIILFQNTANLGKQKGGPHPALWIKNHLAPSYCPPIVRNLDPSLMMSLPAVFMMAE